MRFCPFCNAENADELAVCQACGRRLPPLPPRRARNAPPTGVQLPVRPPTSPTKPPSQITPPVRDSVAAVAPPPMRESVTAISPPPSPPAREAPATIVAPPPPRDSAPALPPPPEPPAFQPPPAPPPWADAGRQALLDALSPAPSAERRPPTAEPVRAPDDPTRRRSDSAPPPTPRAKPASIPPPPPIAAPPPPLQMAPPRPLPLDIAPLRVTSDGTEGPPPTRIHRPEAMVDRPFTPPKVLAVPEIPEPGLVHAAKYAATFWRARWQRRGAIKLLAIEIKQDTEALDQVLGALGRAARGARVESRVFSAENAAINAAEERIGVLQKETAEVEGRKAEENSKFVDVESERNTKLADAERGVDEAQRELANLEGQRRSLRDKRKELERRQKAYLKTAEDHDRQAGGAQMGDQRQELRRAAEGHRREAAALEPDRQEVDRRAGALERPIAEVSARLDAAKAELDAAKRSLNDAREGHTHRLAELDSEQKRKAREIGLAESEISRRLVTLGTLVNLNRVEDPQFAELYMRIDRLRTAITARTTEIEKLTAEREAYDRGTLFRGAAAIGGAFVALIAVIVILRAIL